MRFKSVDELEHFKFQDAQITSFQDESEHLKLELEAVVVRGRHPLNETYTDRYADTVMMRLMGGRIVEAFKEGYKYYDANNVLKEEVADEEMSEADFGKLSKICKDGHIFVLETPHSLKEKLGEQFPCQMEQYMDVNPTQESNADSQIVIMAVDVDSEEEEREYTYWMAIRYEKAILEWEHMMNKPDA